MYGTTGRTFSYFRESLSVSTDIQNSSALSYSQPLTMSQRVNYYIEKVPFIPSFKSFNGVKVIFIVLLLHRLHFYSVFSFIQNIGSFSKNLSDHDYHDEPSFSYKDFATAYYALSFIIGPLSGILADKYFSRHKVISASLLLCFLASCIQSMFFTVYKAHTISTGLYFSITIPTIILLIIGSSGILALLLPYGVDQMEGANEMHISSYIYWFYWFINIGNLFTFGRFFLYVADKSDIDDLMLLLTSYMATLSIFFAVVIFRLSLAYKLLSRVPAIGTPLRNIASVTSEAIKTRISLRKERNIYERTPFLDYAKKSSKIAFKFEEVENVKTFYRILLILISLSGYFSMYSLINNIYPLQGREIFTAFSNKLHSTYPSILYPSALVGLTEPLTVIIVIPLIRLFRKYLPIYTPKIVYSIELGICFALPSVFLSTIVSIINYKYFARNDDAIINMNKNTLLNSYNTDSSYLPYAVLLILIPQCILLSLSEIGAFVGSYEFVYAQSPNNMKGFTFGLLNSVFGICSYIPSLLLLILASASHCPSNRATNMTLNMLCSKCAAFDSQCFSYRNYDFIYPLLFSFFGFIYAIYFYYIAIKYQRRERQEIDQWYY